MPVLKSEKLATLTTSIFTELLMEKRAAKERGLPMIDLSVGSPDMAPPQIVIDTLSQCVKDLSMYGYAIAGLPEFGEAVACFYQNRYGVQLNPRHEVLQLMGSQDGLSHLMMAVLNPGDVVLSPDPGYTVYESSIQIAGGVLYPLPLYEENGFLPDLNAIPEDVARQAKIMIINYPGNPVTALAPESFFEEVVQFAKRYDILIVHDFAYSELIFDGVKPVSFLSVPGAKEVGVEFNSLSKTFNMAGCRIGYAVGNREVLEVLGLFKSHIDFGTFLPIQRAAIAALTSDYTLLETQLAEYTSRRDALYDGLTDAGWSVTKSPATMFMWTKIPEGMTSRKFAFDLLHETGVVVTPGNAFGARGEGYVRMALVQPAIVLRVAAQRIKAFLATMQHC